MIIQGYVPVIQGMSLAPVLFTHVIIMDTKGKASFKTRIFEYIQEITLYTRILDIYEVEGTRYNVQGTTYKAQGTSTGERDVTHLGTPVPRPYYALRVFEDSSAV